ncbi:hypothetical protein JZ751_002321 [Albula glossodonta]|uniref:G protein-activated inward rectifier potassium channel 1 n=1 Tax=Albula glossodonta TaxID=121402 RepID=A0A8T2P7S4_9TELE|nr:hypothetical protein JZ751_002321 [Albula glossodonta]
MIATVICSSVVLQEAQSGHRGHKEYVQTGSPIRQHPRRNSIPPVQSIRAKHMLAYLPRTSQGSLHPHQKKVDPRAVTAVAATACLRGGYSETSPLLLQPLNSQQKKGHWDVIAGLGQSTAGSGKSHCLDYNFKPISSKHHIQGLPCREFDPRTRAPSLFSVPRPLSACCGHGLEQKCVAALVSNERRFNPEGEQRQRYLSKDGKCHVNLGHIKGRARFLSDFFTTLVDLQCCWFLLVFTICYITSWVAFALVYFLDAWLRDDMEHVDDPLWRPCYHHVDGFLSALLLSVESQMTIGYGYRTVTANCAEGVVLLMVQSIVGSIIDVIMVGCMFVKISRPQKRAQTLVFTKRCVVSQRDGRLCLMFRVGDLRESHMVDAKIRAKLIQSRLTKEGEFIPLEQSEINLGFDTGGDRLFLVEPQTITHVINQASPFWEMSAESLRRDSVFLVGMTCRAKTSYTEDEILWGHRFESCMTKEKEAFRVDNGTFENTFAVQTWTGSAKEMEERGGRKRTFLSSSWSTVSDSSLL